MNIIKSLKLTHDYRNISEEGTTETVNRALDDVNIMINEGEFVAILGHNGSGKSTMAKHLNAILMPTGGSLWIGGMDTKDEERLWEIRQTAGMVFQNPDNQIIGMVVEEDVAFGPENLGVPTDEIWKRVEDALNAVRMTEYRKHSPNKLSGGQKQRVAIAGIVAMKPKCIILDEPTAMLDPIGRKEVLKAIHDLNKQEKVTVVLITHYMNEVIDADRIFVMDHGKVVMQGTPKEVFSHTVKLKELGLDIPHVTEVAYALKQAGFDLSEGIIQIDEFVSELLTKHRRCF